MHVELFVAGKVKGVGFRKAGEKVAKSLGLLGYIKNTSNDMVEIRVQGTEESIHKFIAKVENGLETKKAKVEKVTFKEITTLANYSTFRIHHANSNHNIVKEKMLELLEEYNGSNSKKSNNLSFFLELNELVESQQKETIEAISEDIEFINKIKSLIEIRSTIESQLEADWCEEIIAATNPHEELKKFPCIDNYQGLIAQEAQLLKDFGYKQGQKVLFIGSGKLCLSSVLMQRNHSIKVDNLDICSEAIEKSKQIYQKLNLEIESVNFINENITNFSKINQYDFFILASLVGLGEEKEKIIQSIGEKMKLGSHLIVRTCENLRKLIYTEVPIKTIGTLKPVSRTYTIEGVLNALLVFKKEGVLGSVPS